MADKPKPIDNTQLKALVDGMLSDAIHFDSSELAEPRRLALAYQAGEMPDLEAGEGKSAVVEQILADAMGWLLPNLTRIFLSSDRIALYEPVPPKVMPGMPPEAMAAEAARVEAFANQATDYINTEFLRNCGGEKLLRDAIYNGLLHGNGIVKHWWDKTPEFEVEEYSGLNDAQFEELVTSDDVEVLEHSAQPDPSATPFGLSEALPQLMGPGAQSVAGLPAGGGEVAPAGSLGPVPSPMQPPLPGQVPLSGAMAPGGMAGAPAGAVGPALVDALAGPSDGQRAGFEGAPEGGDPGIAGLLGAILPSIGHNMPPPMLHDLKIKRTVSTGRLRVVAVANEDFLIESAARALNEDECRFCAHRDMPTRSDLIRRGYDPDVVWDLGSITETETDTTRRGRNASYREEYEDKAGEKVEVFECYVRLDRDGDGVTELYQVVIGGHSGARELLSVEEWGGRLPFSDLVPDPVPHRWRGRSLYDRLRDPQRVATAFARRINDNLYMTVEPMRAADMTKIENPDTLFDQQLGGIIRTKGPPNTAIMDLAVPFVAKEAVPMLEEQRRIAERRIGVGEQSAGLDADALQGQVATAVAATQSASGLRKEDYARCIQVGVHRIFSNILRLVVENQDRPEQVRVRNQWVPVDPRAWSAEMDVTINVGLGSGNRDRDLAMLQGVLAEQKVMIGQIAPILGLDNPICGIKQYINTLHKMVEAAGIKSPEQFFPEVTPETTQAIQQAMAQKQQAPDPKLIEAQEKAKIDAAVAQQKLVAQQQMNTQALQHKQMLAEADLQADMRVREADMAHRMQIEQQKSERQILEAQLKAEMSERVARVQAEAKIALESAKAEADMRLRERELALEFRLKEAQMMLDVNRQNATNLEMPE